MKSLKTDTSSDITKEITYGKYIWKCNIIIHFEKKKKNTHTQASLIPYPGVQKEVQP